MQQVDLKEQRKSLIYLDSMMVVKQAQLDSVKGNFVLEKDTAYQEVGNYFYPTRGGYLCRNSRLERQL